MTKREFSKSLLDMGFTATAYNSNNAWGFGGVRGESFEKGTLTAAEVEAKLNEYGYYN